MARGAVSSAVWAFARKAPRQALKIFVHPKFLNALGQDRIDAVASFVDKRFILPLRQRQTARHRSDDLATYLKGSFCSKPFETLETTHGGQLFLCCPVWLPTPVGDLTQDPETVWNGPTARAIRESIIDGSFSYCDPVNCSVIAGRTLPRRDTPQARATIDAYQQRGEPTHPAIIGLAHDKSCNLACPSCRADIYVANKARQAKLDGLIETSIIHYLRRAKSVFITGSGDAFGSNHFRRLLSRITAKEGEFPDLRVWLQTNGQLFDEKSWRELNLTGRCDGALISIDASTPETYAYVRRPGRFDRLMKNMAFIKGLRESGELKELSISMVVQTRNFREMGDFIDMAKSFSCDRVTFAMIRQRDVFSRDHFDEAFIGSPDHPEYAAFVEALKDPRLDDPIADLGNVRAYGLYQHID